MNTEEQNKNTPAQENDNDGPNWKWWHFVLAGLLIAAWSVWRFWETKAIKHLGGLILAALCLLLGFGMRKEKA